MTLTDVNWDFENVKWNHVSQKSHAKKKTWSC